MTKPSFKTDQAKATFKDKQSCNNNNSSYMTTLILLIFIQALLLSPITCQQDYLTISIDDSITSVTTTYQFQFIMYSGISIDAGTSILIQFPDQYQNILQDGVFECSLTSWPSDPWPTPVCELTGLSMKVSDMFPTQLDNTFGLIFYIEFQDISNPLYAETTDSFVVRFIRPDNSEISNIEASGVDIGQGKMTCSLSPSPSVSTTIGQDSLLVFALTPTKLFPPDTALTVELPLLWPQTTQNNPNFYILNTNNDAISCRAVSTNVQGSISCQIIVSPSVFKISITGIVATDTSQQIQFSIGPSRNPPSIKPQGNIKVTSMRLSLQKIMQSCSDLQISDVTPGILRSESFSMQNSQVFATSEGYLQIVLNSLFQQTDQLVVIFPESIGLQSLTQLKNANNIDAIYDPVITGQTMKVSGFSGSKNSIISLVLRDLINPSSELTTEGFAVSTQRNGYTMEKIGDGVLTYNAVRGSITLVSMESSRYQIGVGDNTYTIVIELSHYEKLSTASALVLQIPTAFQGRIGSCQLSTSPQSCTLSLTTATFQFSSNIIINSFGQSAATPGQLTLQLLDVVNPLSLGITPSFRAYTLQILSNPQTVVDQITSGVEIELIAREMPSDSVTLQSVSSNIVYNFPTTYFFSVTNSNELPIGTSLDVVLPGTVSAGQQVDFSCVYGGVPINCAATTVDEATTTITTVNVGPFDRIIAAGDLSSSNIQINNLYNPTSSRPTDPFKFYLKNSISQTIEYLDKNGPIHTVTNGAQFVTLSLSTNSAKNSADDTELSIVFGGIPVDFGKSTTFLLAVSFPEEITDLSGVTCSAISPASLTGGVECAVDSSTTGVVNVLLEYSENEIITHTEITIQGFTNFPSFQPHEYRLQLYQTKDPNSLNNPSAQLYLICTTTNTNTDLSLLTITNSQFNEITVSSYIWGNPALSSESSLQFEINSVSSALSQIDFIVVRLPSQYTINTKACVVDVDPNAKCRIDNPNYESSYVIAINAGTLTSLPFSITLKNITTPQFASLSPIVVQTYSASKYLMDSSSQITFKSMCTLPCRTCDQQTPTICQSCYTDPTLVAGMVILDGEECVSTCSNSSQYVNIVTIQCQACQDTCKTCLDSPQNCLSCKGPRLLLNGQCLTECPAKGYYPETGPLNLRCLPCEPTRNCESCQNSVECVSCLPQYLLYNSQCYTTCPALLITYPNTLTRKCQPCPQNCSQCTGTYVQQTCTACKPTFFLDSGGCYQQCVTPGLVPLNKECVTCSSPCQMCSLTPSNCTACDHLSDNPYLHNFRCLTTCPATYYNDQDMYTCSVCTSPCETCLNVSANSCLSCMAPYVYHSPTFSCLPTCPIGYYSPEGIRCQTCVNPCQTCTTEFICLSCKSTYFLYGNICVTECDVGMTIINGNQCQMCDKPSRCSTCLTADPSYCTSCLTNSFLYNGTCDVTCPQGSFRLEKTCITCTPPCLECQSLSFCDSCVSNSHVLQNGQCIVQCTPPLVNISSICLRCDASCKTCHISTTICLICSDPNPSPFYYIASTRTCALSCPTGIRLMSASGLTSTVVNNECVDQCPKSMYNQSNQCVDCTKVGCLDCSSAQVCMQCDITASPNPYFLYQGGCVTGCPQNAPFQYSSSSGAIQCKVCDIASCKVCLNSSHCQTCQQTFLIIDIKQMVDNTQNTELSVGSQCIASCQTGYLYNSSAQGCQKQDSKQDNNDTNTNNTSNNTNPSTSSQISSTIPPYIRLYVTAGLSLMIIISKIQSPQHTNLFICLLVAIGICNTFVLVHVEYLQLSQLLQFYSSSGTQTNITTVAASSISQMLSNDLIPLSVYFITSAVFLHVISTIGGFIGLVIIRDYVFINLFKEHIVVGVLILVFMLLDPKVLIILSSGFLGVGFFKLKYCSDAMLKLIRFILGLAVLQFIMQVVYCIIVLVNGSAANEGERRRLFIKRLLPELVGQSVPESGYIIELLIIAGLLLFLAVAVLTLNVEQFLITDARPKTSVRSRTQSKLSRNPDSRNRRGTHTDEQNESMKSINEDKQAFERRNNQSLLLSMGDDQFGQSVNQFNLLGDNDQNGGGSRHSGNSNDRSYKKNFKKKNVFDRQQQNAQADQFSELRSQNQQSAEKLLTSSPNKKVKQIEEDIQLFDDNQPKIAQNQKTKRIKTQNQGETGGLRDNQRKMRKTSTEHNYPKDTLRFVQNTKPSAQQQSQQFQVIHVEPDPKQKDKKIQEEIEAMIKSDHYNVKKFGQQEQLEQCGDFIYKEGKLGGEGEREGSSDDDDNKEQSKINNVNDSTKNQASSFTAANSIEQQKKLDKQSQSKLSRKQSKVASTSNIPSPAPVSKNKFLQPQSPQKSQSVASLPINSNKIKHADDSKTKDFNGVDKNKNSLNQFSKRKLSNQDVRSGSQKRQQQVSEERNQARQRTGFSKNKNPGSSSKQSSPLKMGPSSLLVKNDSQSNQNVSGISTKIFQNNDKLENQQQKNPSKQQQQQSKYSSSNKSTNKSKLTKNKKGHNIKKQNGSKADYNDKNTPQEQQNLKDSSLLQKKKKTQNSQIQEQEDQTVVKQLIFKEDDDNVQQNLNEQQLNKKNGIKYQESLSLNQQNEDHDELVNKNDHKGDNDLNDDDSVYQAKQGIYYEQSDSDYNIVQQKNNANLNKGKHHNGQQPGRYECQELEQVSQSQKRQKANFRLTSLNTLEQDMLQNNQQNGNNIKMKSLNYEKGSFKGKRRNKNLKSTQNKIKEDNLLDDQSDDDYNTKPSELFKRSAKDAEKMVLEDF